MARTTPAAAAFAFCSDVPASTRAGHYRRKQHTKAGKVDVKMPKLRQQMFDTAIIERYRRRDISIEEAIMQMNLVSTATKN